MWDLLKYSGSRVTKFGEITADIFTVLVLIVIFAAPILHAR